MDAGRVSVSGKEGDRIVLAPGFRFHPMDEELITCYLTPKVIDSNFTASAIGDVDLNKVEPWELPWKAKMGEKEWYFFCLRDKKYPTGLRTNRATAAGYWKATGKDKEIFRGQFLIGMKKTLVFYTGRAPKGEKTNWIMHEYRLEGEHSLQNLPKTARNEWVISRVFEKTSTGKRLHFSQLMPSPPTPDPSSPLISGKPVHVPCFSNLAGIHKLDGQGIGSTSNVIIPPMNPQPNSFYTPNPMPAWSNMQYPNLVSPRDQSYLMNVEMMNNNINNIINNGQENTNNYVLKNEMETRGVRNDEFSPLVSNNPEMMNYRGRFDDYFDWANGF